MNIANIGWIGLGKMGNPMVQHLVKAGYNVTVNNRTKEKEEAVKAMGARVAATPRAVIQSTDVVILMVTDDAAIQELFSGPDGLLSAYTSEKVIINMSTVSPGINREMAQLCRQQGIAYVDAPVSGSVKQAQDAQLVILAGGDKAVYEQVKPVLEKMGKLTMYMGALGAGNTAKLAINALLSFYTQGLAEAISFIEKKGLNVNDFITIINSGALANPFTKIKSEAIVSNNYAPAFLLKHIVKDLGLAKDEGFTTPLAQAALDTFTRAEKEYGDEDLIAVVKHIRKAV